MIQCYAILHYSVYYVITPPRVRASWPPWTACRRLRRDYVIVCYAILHYITLYYVTLDYGMLYYSSILLYAAGVVKFGKGQMVSALIGVTANSLFLLQRDFWDNYSR